MSQTESLPAKRDQAKLVSHKSSFDAEVADATLMLNFAIANGVSGPNNAKLSDAIIEAVKQAQDLAGKNEPPNAEERAKFEIAYRDLALFLHPVTAETLKATTDIFGIRSLFVTPWAAKSRAIVWSRKLTAWTLLFVALALIGEWFESVYGELPEFSAIDVLPSFGQGLQVTLHILVPFTYGAIGACIFLLKTSHSYIHKRQFDPLRIPEYYSRMILGAVAGGMIVVLVRQVAGDDGAAISLSAAALGFLAGYNNDLLFAAIERISNALLPKIGWESIQEKAKKDVSTIVADISLTDLLDRRDKAKTPADKELYTGLIKQIQQRL